MSVRDNIIKRTFEPVEIGDEAKKLIDVYRYNKEVFDEDYDLRPLYALLKIMTYVKKYALIIAKKSIDSSEVSNHVRENYLIYCKYREEFNIAYAEFVKHFKPYEELFELLNDIRGKLEKSIAVKYTDNISLMMDIVDTNSLLYEVEGIGYAK